MRTKEAHPRTHVARILDQVRVLPVFRNYPTLYVSSALRGWQRRDDLAGVRSFLLFVGHPRSGHSLVGSLLDAHRNVVVSHELDALKYVAAGFGRSQLLTMVIEHSRDNAARGRKSWGYSYAVPGQWQGRHERLEVVGDKRGRRSTARLAENPALLERLEDVVGVPVSVVQVVRDPLDNISTMWRRGTRPLEAQIETYFTLSRTCDDVASRVAPERFHRMHLEDLIADPRERLADLVRFVGVDPEPAYLDACAAIMFESPKRTREDAPWTPELVAEVRRRAAAHDWLAPYLVP